VKFHRIFLVPGGLALEAAAPARRIWLNKSRCGIVGTQKFSSKLFFVLKHRRLEYVAAQEVVWNVAVLSSQFSVLSSQFSEKASPTRALLSTFLGENILWRRGWVETEN
jgi:hypothetical protein